MKLKTLFVLFLVLVAVVQITSFLENRKKDAERARLGNLSDAAENISRVFYSDPGEESLNELKKLVEELEKNLYPTYGYLIAEKEFHLSLHKQLIDFQNIPDFVATEIARNQYLEAKEEFRNFPLVSEKTVSLLIGFDYTITYYETVYAMRDLWSSLDSKDKLDPEKIDKIYSILKKYDGGPIVNSAIGMVNSPIDQLCVIYPKIKTELVRIY